MTTDFLITIGQDAHTPDIARAVKPSSELNHRRCCEKLEIERRYWQERGIDWGLVTEHELSPILADNLALIAPYEEIQDRVVLPPAAVDQVAAFLTGLVATERGALADLAARGDAHFGFAPGVCLTIAYHLLARQRWKVDLQQPLHPQRPLLFLSSEQKPPSRAS